MTTQYLRDNWTLTVLGENVYNIPNTPIETKVPSTVYGTLLTKNLMPDPYYRDNELAATRLMENDFAYETTFTLGKEDREADRLFLRFDGIDTLADIYLDGERLGTACNMNRVWEYDITGRVMDDEEDAAHHLKVVLHSPIRYIAEENEKCPVGGSSDAMPGFPHLRKAACMFGWDWGPRLPDAGLFREVTVTAVKTARIAQVYVTQQHQVAERTKRGNTVSSVGLTADAEIEWMRSAGEEPVRLIVFVTGPDGSVLSAESEAVSAGADTAPSGNLTGLDSGLRSSHVRAELTVSHPQLWWPNGYGEQPLYRVEALLVSARDACKEAGGSPSRETCKEAVGNPSRETCETADENPCRHTAGKARPLDVWRKRIGLRTMTVNTDPLPDETWDVHLTNQTEDMDDGNDFIMNHGDRKIIMADKKGRKLPGRNFAIEVNGLQIFAMGADYIPEDNILTRQTKERTDMLLASAQEAHHNCIRIWGGGYFPDDFFYDVCDERGLVIWHDFMFACASYELNAAFEANVSAEIRQNIRRLRSHPSIGLWCGNNEMETQYETLAWPRTKKQYYDYIRLYEYIIPKIVEEEDPQTFYWPSSPSSGGNFENSNAENVGDVHYWGVWHGSEPFTAYRNHHYRFLSEFGFQSFPALQTIRRFTKEEDRNIYSRVMELHQRNTSANGKISNYLSQTYLYPKNFDQLLYCSQLLQADAIRYGVEHFRRFRGTCMGTVVWQLNDIWPVASWASLDYYGNWKALHYAEKRMFAPVLLSCEEHGEIDQKPYVNTLPRPIDFSADLHVANETGEPVSGIVKWALRLPDSSVVREGQFEVTAPAYGGVWLPHLDCNDIDPLKVHLEYALYVDGTNVSSGTALFCAPKHYAFLDPELSVSVEGDTVTVTASNYAKSVSVEREEGILRLDDNFVDMEAGSRMFRILPGRDFTDGTDAAAAVSGAYRARSVYEVSDR
nr:glycoside hydrolase family 2 protein [uncultured Acetatifactor sp.]